MGEFSVVQFFDNDTYEYVRRGVTAQEAVEASAHYCGSVGARLGYVTKVMITDGDDYCVFQWEHGKGVVFPPEAAGFEPR
jgi:predicted metallo-beta-lactamase superfamily hydrolase